MTQNDKDQTSIYSQHLDQVTANYEALSPLTLIERAAAVYPERISIIHGDQKFTWIETYKRCRQLASALKKLGINAEDTVAVMSPNVPALYEAHFGVAMAGAVLNALNIRLDATTIVFILEHGEAKVLITDKEFSPTIKAALAQLKSPPIIIDINDPLGQGEKCWVIKLMNNLYNKVILNLTGRDQQMSGRPSH